MQKLIGSAYGRDTDCTDCTHCTDSTDRDFALFYLASKSKILG